MPANRAVGEAPAHFGATSVRFASDSGTNISVYPTVSDAVHNRVRKRLGFLHHLVAPLLLIQLHPRLGIATDQLRPIDQLPKLTCPVLIASGDSDAHTTGNETRRMFAACKEPKRLVLFEGAAHVDLLAHAPAKYEREILGFLDDVFARPR
ncbi:MAG: alpha/beta hydrolase [Planctomycetota bacterium]